MRRLPRFVSYLYPPRWRARYGAEFEALLEQMNPGPGDVRNLLLGALRMHMTEWSTLRIVAAFSLLGLAAGGIAQLAIHTRYASSGTVTTTSKHGAALALKQVLSRPSLKEIIDQNHLYTSERQGQPLEDVIERMRSRDLAFKPVSPTSMSVTFLYPDQVAAQQTVRALMARLEGDPAFQTVSAASAPEVRAPNRRWIFISTFSLAMMLGLLTAFLSRVPGQTLRTLAIFGLAGALLAGGVSYLVPESYISRAVMVTADGTAPPIDRLSDAAIAAEMDARHLYGGDQSGKLPMKDLVRRFRKSFSLHRGTTFGSTPALDLSFEAAHAREAQRGNQFLIAMVNDACKGTTMEVLENASLPESPAGPNHLVAALLGLLSGIVAELIRTRFPALRQSRGVAVNPG